MFILKELTVYSVREGVNTKSQKMVSEVYVKFMVQETVYKSLEWIPTKHSWIFRWEIPNTRSHNICQRRC